MKHKRYEIIKLIEKGAYGNVYKSKDLRNNSYVAIKRIKMKSDTSNLYNEINIPKKFNDKSIINILDQYTDSEHINIVSDYYDNPDLFNYIHQNKQTINNLVDLFLKMSNSIYLLNQKNIVHLDIKTENYIHNKNHLVLIDFGSAKCLSSNNKLYNLYHKAGTESYCAPEVLDNYVHLNSDMWSLGISMINMINMNYPITNESKVSIDDKFKVSIDDNLNHIHDKISPELFDILESILIEDPFKRADINTVYHKFIDIIT